MKFLILTSLFLSSLAFANEASVKRNHPNLFLAHTHLIEANDQTGFAIYRTSQPKREDVREWCEMGIEEIFVLSGDAEKYEIKYADECPTLKVVYNEEQDGKSPLTTSFLQKFDNWVEEAQRVGKKIIFRCTCGCHRTGRLAAYYQMKYQNLSYEDAEILMSKHGKWMFTQRQLYPQIRSIFEHLKGLPCSVRKKHCLIDDL